VRRSDQPGASAKNGEGDPYLFFPDLRKLGCVIQNWERTPLHLPLHTPLVVVEADESPHTQAVAPVSKKREKCPFLSIYPTLTIGLRTLLAVGYGIYFQGRGDYLSVQ
jgi:hypothetical protein